MDSIPKGMVPLINRGLGLTLSLPGVVLDRMAGTLPEGGELITPDQRLLASLLARAGAESVEGIPVDVQRAQTDLSPGIVGIRGAGGGLEVTEHEVMGAEGTLRMRLYAPIVNRQEPGSLLVWFHGGGWVVGSIASHDPALRLLALESGVPIATVEYRLAPEHPWPAAPDDCLAAWRDIRHRAAKFGADPDRMMVGGDSAGGNLAAVLCLELDWADEALPAAAVLLYPVADLAGKSDSYHRFKKGFFLSEEKMDFYRDSYLPKGVDRADPRVSPLRSQRLGAFPPSLVVTAAADPLRDEGEALAERLRAEGVEVESDRLPLIHGWLNMLVAPSSRRALDSLAAGVAALAAKVTPGG